MSSSSSSSSSLSQEILAVEDRIRQIKVEIKNAYSKIDFQNLESNLSRYWLKKVEQMREKELLLIQSQFVFSKFGSKKMFSCFSLGAALSQNAGPLGGQSYQLGRKGTFCFELGDALFFDQI